jgi:hypothetical protein
MHIKKWLPNPFFEASRRCYNYISPLNHIIHQGRYVSGLLDHQKSIKGSYIEPIIFINCKKILMTLLASSAQDTTPSKEKYFLIKYESKAYQVLLNLFRIIDHVFLVKLKTS